MAGFPLPLACLLLILPFIYYFVLWVRPTHWMNFCRRFGKRDACHAMYQVSAAGKVLQLTAFCSWYLCAASSITLGEVLNLPAWRLAGGLLAIVTGQALNIGVFRALGKEGVFYGCRFGKTIPWCTTWPYGGPLSVRHPQYVGAVLSVLGLTALIATSTHIEAGLLWLTFSWCAGSVAAAIWEDHF